MKYQRQLSESLRSLERFKLRSFFMSVGVILGVATLVVGSTLGRGAEQMITDQINQMFGPGTILVTSYELKAPDLDAVKDRVDQVIAFGPRIQFGEKEIRYAGTNARAGVAGYTANAEQVWNRSVTSGRFFTARDIDRASRVALIGDKLEAELFGTGSGIGEEILVDAVPFEIVGILEPIGIDPHGEDRDMEVYLPSTTVQRRLANSDVVGMAKLVVRDAERVEEVAEEVAVVLRERFNVAEGERDTFGVYTSRYADAAAAGMKRMLKVYVAVAAAVVLLVAAVVISSIMLVVVRERVPEIGLRKAVGATPRSIAMQFVWEVTTISLVSGLVGTVVGFGFAGLFANLYRIPVAVQPSGVAIALAASVVVGILAGILPARRAARLDPIEALR
jgi:putative ABC transport system permease protein